MKRKLTFVKYLAEEILIAEREDFSNTFTSTRARPTLCAGPRLHRRRRGRQPVELCPSLPTRPEEEGEIRIENDKLAETRQLCA